MSGFLKNTLYFLKNRNVFTFSGGDIKCKIIYDTSGVDWLTGFRLFDERGKREIKTKHPETLRRLIKTKNSLTFQIKQWAEGRAEGTLPLDLFSKRTAKERYGMSDDFLTETTDIETEYNLPEWVVNAVESQRKIFY